jgi:hypothetical protein
MTVALVRYDAARKALAAAHRVDEVKQIRDKAEAVRVYARQAGDFELQNQAAEIRILAERRAGELLVGMAMHPGARGEGRPRRDGRRIRLSSCVTAYPPKLDDLGVTRNQSSKWQRLAKLIDEDTFERALTRAKEKNVELTTAALLREIKEIVKPPAGGVVVPDVNVIAAELIREIESASRKEKLEAVVRLRSRLNPTIRRNLISALKTSMAHCATFEEQLSADFTDFPRNGKCHQRIVREMMAEQPDPLLEEKKALASDFMNAIVREISYEEAKQVVIANEYLASMGTTEFSFGLYFGEHLAGTASFGRTGGTQVAASICGSEHAHRVATLCRGACVHWAHAHSASFLINAACKEMTKKGYNIFVAYSDPNAGEIGTVYQASNWLYCGTTNPTEKFRTPSGEVKDARLVSAYSRDRTGGTLKYRRTRAEQKQLLVEEGCEFFKDGGRKHRYAGIYGDRRIKRILRRALKWEVLPYPKRQRPLEATETAPQPAEVDLPIPSLRSPENVRPGV